MTNPLDIHKYIDNLPLVRDLKAHDVTGAKYYYQLLDDVTIEVSYSSVYGNTYEIIAANGLVFRAKTNVFGRHRVHRYEIPFAWVDSLVEKSLEGLDVRDDDD